LQTIEETLQPDCQESYRLHAEHLYFHGKAPQQIGSVAFFEYYFMRFSPHIDHAPGDEGGYFLNPTGQARYNALMGIANE